MPNRLHLDKPILDLPGFVQEAVSVARHLPTLAGIYTLRTISPTMREELWVAVSSANECRYCSFVHQAWAKRSGVSDDTICELEHRDFSRLSVRERAAARYLTEWIANDFDRVSEQTHQQFQESLSRAEQRRVKTLGRLINFFNRSGNTADAFLSRLKSEPYRGSRVFDEAVITGIFAYVNIFLIPLLALGRGESPKRLVNDFKAFTEKFESRFGGNHPEH